MAKIPTIFCYYARVAAISNISTNQHYTVELQDVVLDDPLLFDLECCDQNIDKTFKKPNYCKNTNNVVTLGGKIDKWDNNFSYGIKLLKGTRVFSEECEFWSCLDQDLIVLLIDGYFEISGQVLQYVSDKQHDMKFSLVDKNCKRVINYDHYFSLCQEIDEEYNDEFDQIGVLHLDNDEDYRVYYQNQLVISTNSNLIPLDEFVADFSRKYERTLVGTLDIDNFYGYYVRYDNLNNMVFIGNSYAGYQDLTTWIKKNLKI